MTGRRLKAIAAQAVVVGALLIVVSLTLLRSDNTASLFDIDAPGPERSIGPASGGDGDSGDDRGSGASGGDPTPTLGIGVASAGLPGDEIAPSGPAPLRAPPPSLGETPVEQSPVGESPVDDQYGGSIARLNLAIE